MRSQRQVGCLWCEIRYWADIVLRLQFQFCESCQGRMRLTQSAWKDWSQKATGLPPR
jgi:hypothetical protein